jgi:hypothetical protein
LILKTTEQKFKEKSLGNRVKVQSLDPKKNAEKIEGK